MNKLFKNKILLLLIVAALGCFSAFFVSCNASLNETDNSQTETPDEDGETQKPADPSEEAFMWALSGVLGYGAEGELSLDLGGERIRGTVRADFSESLLAFVDLDIKGTKISLGMQAADGQKLVLAELFGEKLYFDLDDLPEVAYRISALADETLPPVEDGAYPPFVIGGTDVGALLSVLDEFNAYTLISLMNGADIVGTPAENGGYDYRFALGDAFSADLWVDGERALKTVSLRVAAGETEVSLALENIAYPETPIAAKPAGEYKNLKNYLVLIESFCKEKIESVPALIETIKNFDFGKAGQLIAAVAQNKSVAFDVALTVQNTPIAAAVTLDFANGFKASVAAEVAGAEIALYYAEDTLYLNAGAIALQCSLETVGEILSMFGVERTALADLPVLLKNFAAGIEIEYISAEGDKIYAGVSGLEIEFDTKTFSLKISSEAFSAQLNALAAGGRVDVPAAEYSEFAAIGEVAESLYKMIGGMKFEVAGSFDLNGTQIVFENARVYSTGDGRDLTADFNSGKISLGGTLLVGGTHKIQVSFDGTNMYLCYNDAMKVVMSKSSLDVVAKVLKENFAFILDGFVKADELTDMVNAKDYGAIVSALRSLKSYRDEAQLPVVELEIGLGDGAIGLVLRKTAENGVGVTLAENQTFTITKSDVSEAPVTAPADADVYMNLSDISYLADAFFKTANKNVFKLSGDIKVNLNVLGIKADLSVGLEANVRINKNAEGRITGVDAYVVFDNTRVAKKGSQDVENTTVSAIHDLALKYGKSVITFTGDTLYIDRMNMKKSLETVSWWPIKSGYQFAETAYEHKKIAAADCTGDALKDLIFYALGVNTNLVNMFKFDGTPDIASVLGGYSSGNIVNGVPQEHNVTLNLAALTGSDMFKPSTFQITANAENLLVGLNIEELLIDFGVGTVKVGLSAENDLDGVLDESCFEEYLNNENEYQPFI